MRKKLDGSGIVALVTGATAGMGAATARRFVLEGGRVIAIGRRQDRLAELQLELGAERCHVAAVDVRSHARFVQLIQTLPMPFRNINVLVANAGLALGLSPAELVDLDDWEAMVDTNIKGLMYSVRAVLPGMIERGGGVVVTVGSVSGDYSYPGANVYGATKAFVRQFALNLRCDMPGKNVRVVNIEPGATETEFSLVRFQGDPGPSDTLYNDTAPLSGDDIAECIFWAATLPPHVNVNRIQVMPTSQTFGNFVIHKTNG